MPDQIDRSDDIEKIAARHNEMISTSAALRYRAVFERGLAHWLVVERNRTTDSLVDAWAFVTKGEAKQFCYDRVRLCIAGPGTDYVLYLEEANAVPSGA